MGLIRLLFWVALFLASTFAFTVLFEHGTLDYSANAQHEWEALMKYYQEARTGKTDAKK